MPARLIAPAAVALALACACASPAAAATHDYCYWDGTYAALSSFTLCFQSGENLLTQNHAWLPYEPTVPTIYCGAHQAGVQYAGYTSGNPSCTHTYSGLNSLKADEYVDSSATTHGTITW